MKNYLDVYFIAGTQDVNEGSLEDVLDQALQAGVTAFQLREKGEKSVANNQEELITLAKKLQNICKRYKVPFIVNDDVDLAITLNADGVHVGQDDEDVESVIERFGKDKIIGLSTSNALQVRAAKEIENLSYIGIGPVYPSLSKSDTDPELGVEGLRQLVEEINGLKTVAIGGITTENVKEVRTSNVDGVSVITAISKADDIKKAVEILETH